MSLELKNQEQVTPQVADPGDHELFSHYVRTDKLEKAIFEGSSVVALCGKVWLPTKDPKKFPVCPECKDIWEGLRPGDGGDTE